MRANLNSGASPQSPAEAELAFDGSDTDAAEAGYGQLEDADGSYEEAEFSDANDPEFDDRDELTANPDDEDSEYSDGDYSDGGHEAARPADRRGRAGSARDDSEWADSEWSGRGDDEDEAPVSAARAGGRAAGRGG